MNTLSYKTISVNKANADKQWLIVDATDQPLGRLASKVAKILRGKHKPNFTPHADCGDYVIIINADKFALSGNKWEDKKYIWHTGYPGGQKFVTADVLFKRDPRRVVEHAVKGMLPKNRLGRAIYKNMYLFEGDNHTLQAQKPTLININEFN